MFSYIKAPFIWLKDQWVKFNTWFAQFMPGWKTQIVNGIGVVGSGAAIMHDYIAQLPLDRFITANQIAIAGIFLFTLSFWGRHLANYDNAS